MYSSNRRKPESTRDARIDDVGTVPVGMDDVGPPPGAQGPYGSPLASIGSGRKAQHGMLDPQSVEKRMATRPLTIQDGGDMDPIAPSRLAFGKGSDDTFEPADLTWRNHMDDCDIVVCLQHREAVRARWADCQMTRKVRPLRLLAKALPVGSARARWPLLCYVGCA